MVKTFCLTFSIWPDPCQNFNEATEMRTISRKKYNLFILYFQYWMLSKTGEIRRDEACLDYAGSDVILYPCHGSKGNQFWEYTHEVINYL